MTIKTESSTEQRTLVTLLLDRSGSMSDVLDSTIEAFNGYKTGLAREGEGKIDLTLVTFDSQSLDRVHVAVPVEKVPDLSRETYVPRGGTPLIEASIKTIEAVDRSLKERGPRKVVIAIQTDGNENASGPEYTWDRLQTLIREKTEAGWEFNFMGCGINAYTQGARMGVSQANTMSYGKAPEQTRSAFAASATNTAGFAKGTLRSTAYSSLQKMSAGDRFDVDAVGVSSEGPTGHAVLPKPRDIARPRPMVPTSRSFGPKRVGLGSLDLSGDSGVKVDTHDLVL